ncbi:efflux RND transporter periplasmic adaptor subunit [Niabella drilacis]|uniref:HlyD family secretion protein n=1 Tax=Niabella drilacis (strain DSM 25811 / CCM 8410 / CCUG 62505 / LMG 26954 / E90) TaxID=1285928 RepID=A0A1G6LZS9_NIADE|nr:efflux RND transporter periplasmic adaptor subunit [Niabella drilacis]SDC48721.1 HlyD family secretion protein [Niabella drilacis]
MKKKWKRILLIIAGVIVLLVLYAVFSNKDKNLVKVAAEKAAIRSITETVTASGQIYPEYEVKISPDVSGEITELNVEEGDSVKRGQVLARVYADNYALDRDEASARLGQSQANVANSQEALGVQKATMVRAQQAYDRNKRLYDDRVISKAEFEQYETDLASAKASYNASLQNIRSLQAGVRSSQTGLVAANKVLGRATIFSPINGIISSLKVEKGERVVGTAQMAGTEMMTVADMNTMEVRVNVGENDIVKVSIGDNADIEVDAYSGRKFAGIVTKIASSVKSALTTGTATSNDVTNYEVRIRIDKNSYQDLVDPQHPRKFPFRPGMNASAEIKTKRKENIITVPIASVNARVKGSDKSLNDTRKEQQEQKDNGAGNADDNSNAGDMEEVVYLVMKDGIVKKRIVKTGIQDINYIEITSGLKAGDEVVTGPYSAVSQTLKDDTKVKVVSKEELFKAK